MGVTIGYSGSRVRKARVRASTTSPRDGCLWISRSEVPMSCASVTVSSRTIQTSCDGPVRAWAGKTAITWIIQSAKDINTNDGSSSVRFVLLPWDWGEWSELYSHRNLQRSQPHLHVCQKPTPYQPHVLLHWSWYFDPRTIQITSSYCGRSDWIIRH